MPTLTDLNIPIKWGGTTQYYDVRLGTDITKLELPVLEGGQIVNKTYDLPTGGEVADVIISVEAAYYEGCTCELYTVSDASVLIDSKVITNGKTRFDRSDITGNIRVTIIDGSTTIDRILNVESKHAYVVTFKHTTTISVTLYSAPNDTVIIEDELGVSTEVMDGNGVAENVDITITDGLTEVTFISTIAKSLTSENEAYRKTVVIDGTQTPPSEIYIMPVELGLVLYWYGYRNYEAPITANGWTLPKASSGTRYTYGANILNTNDIQLGVSGGTLRYSGIATNGKINAIAGKKVYVKRKLTAYGNTSTKTAVSISFFNSKNLETSNIIEGMIEIEYPLNEIDTIIYEVETTLEEQAYCTISISNNGVANVYAVVVEQ